MKIKIKFEIFSSILSGEDVLLFLSGNDDGDDDGDDDGNDGDDDGNEKFLLKKIRCFARLVANNTSLTAAGFVSTPLHLMVLWQRSTSTSTSMSMSMSMLTTFMNAR